MEFVFEKENRGRNSYHHFFKSLSQSEKTEGRLNNV